MICRVPFSSRLARGWTPTRTLPSFSHPTLPGGSWAPAPQGSRTVAPAGSTVRLVGSRLITAGWSSVGATGRKLGIAGCWGGCHSHTECATDTGLTPCHLQACPGQDTAGHADSLAQVVAGITGLDLDDGQSTAGAHPNTARRNWGLAREQQGLRGSGISGGIREGEDGKQGMRR